MCVFPFSDGKVILQDGEITSSRGELQGSPVISDIGSNNWNNHFGAVSVRTLSVILRKQPNYDLCQLF